MARYYGYREDERNFKVYINHGEMDQIKKWVLMHDNIETGGDLFGLWIDQHTAVVQFVLGPGKQCKRTGVSFYQDVNYLEKAGKYLTKQHGLCNIGQWHSHHRLNLCRPSGGDENTVWGNMPNLGLNRYIVFIATIQGVYYNESTASVNCFLFETQNGRQLPVLKGTFCQLYGNSPFRLDNEIRWKTKEGAESTNEVKDFEGKVKKVKGLRESENEQGKKQRKVHPEDQRSREGLGKEMISVSYEAGKRSGEFKEQARKEGAVDRQFQVFIHEGEMDQIAKWVLMNDNIETGGGLFGLWIDQHTAVVQLVLGPGQHCEGTSNSLQGVKYLEEAGKYLTGQHGLCNLGQWYSRHRMSSLDHPSEGDKSTVWSNMTQLGLSRYIVFIATIKEDRKPTVNCFLFENKGDRQLTVLRGSFCDPLLNGDSPFRLDKLIVQQIREEAESIRDSNEQRIAKRPCETGDSNESQSKIQKLEEETTPGASSREGHEEEVKKPFYESEELPTEMEDEENWTGNQQIVQVSPKLEQKNVEQCSTSSNEGLQGSKDDNGCHKEGSCTDAKNESQLEQPEKENAIDGQHEQQTTERSRECDQEEPAVQAERDLQEEGPTDDKSDPSTDQDEVNDTLRENASMMNVCGAVTPLETTNNDTQEDKVSSKDSIQDGKDSLVDLLAKGDEDNDSLQELKNSNVSGAEKAAEPTDKDTQNDKEFNEDSSQDGIDSLADSSREQNEDSDSAQLNDTAMKRVTDKKEVGDKLTKDDELPLVGSAVGQDKSDKDAQQDASFSKDLTANEAVETTETDLTREEDEVNDGVLKDNKALFSSSTTGQEKANEGPQDAEPNNTALKGEEDTDVCYPTKESKALPMGLSFSAEQDVSNNKFGTAMNDRTLVAATEAKGKDIQVDKQPNYNLTRDGSISLENPLAEKDKTADEHLREDAPGKIDWIEEEDNEKLLTYDPTKDEDVPLTSSTKHKERGSDIPHEDVTMNDALVCDGAEAIIPEGATEVQDNEKSTDDPTKNEKVPLKSSTKQQKRGSYILAMKDSDEGDKKGDWIQRSIFDALPYNSTESEQRYIKQGNEQERTTAKDECRTQEPTATIPSETKEKPQQQKKLTMEEAATQDEKMTREKSDVTATNDKIIGNSPSGIENISKDKTPKEIQARSGQGIMRDSSANDNEKISKNEKKEEVPRASHKNESLQDKDESLHVKESKSKKKKERKDEIKSITADGGDGGVQDEDEMVQSKDNLKTKKSKKKWYKKKRGKKSKKGKKIEGSAANDRSGGVQDENEMILGEDDNSCKNKRVKTSKKVKTSPDDDGSRGVRDEDHELVHGENNSKKRKSKKSGGKQKVKRSTTNDGDDGAQDEGEMILGKENSKEKRGKKKWYKWSKKEKIKSSTADEMDGRDVEDGDEMLHGEANPKKKKDKKSKKEKKIKRSTNDGNDGVQDEDEMVHGEANPKKKKGKKNKKKKKIKESTNDGDDGVQDEDETVHGEETSKKKWYRRKWDKKSKKQKKIKSSTANDGSGGVPDEDEVAHGEKITKKKRGKKNKNEKKIKTSTADDGDDGVQNNWKRKWYKRSKKDKKIKNSAADA